jgi:hypothetical protein
MNTDCFCMDRTLMNTDGHRFFLLFLICEDLCRSVSYRRSNREKGICVYPVDLRPIRRRVLTWGVGMLLCDFMGKRRAE